MSAGRIANQMRMQALLAAGKLGAPKHGLVTSYDPTNYRVKVMIQPEAIETGWLPITLLMAGQGFGAYFGPSQNDQATLLFQEGDREVGFCIGFLSDDDDPPPPNGVQSGEIHLLAKTHGAQVTLLQDGSLNLSTGATGGDGDTPATLTLKPDGTIASAGTWTHTGDFTATQTITGQTDVIADGVSGKGHKHPVPNVQGGSSTIESNPPG